MDGKRLLGTAAFLALAGTVGAQTPLGLIKVGSPMRWGGTNSPSTYSDATTFSPTPALVNGGRVRIWQEQKATGTNGEWEIFHMETTDGSSIAGDVNGNWSILLDYTTTVPVSFDQVANQFKVDGRPVSSISNFGSICCAALTNPIFPGAAYYNSGFNGLLPAGEQKNWQQIFINPFSFANSGGVPTTRVNGFSFALHFTLRPEGSPAIRSTISAGAFGTQNGIAPGTWIEIYGSGFSSGTQNWATEDFDGGFAPTKLGGVQVSVGGRNAFVNFVSPGQVNAQVPANVGAGQQPVVVTTPNGASPPFSINVDSVKPGLLAPPAFSIGGTQHVVALLPDGAFVLPPGAIPGVNSRRVRPGETVVLYGIGFGGVTPNVAPGQITTALNALAAPFAIRFAGTAATVSYSGLAPNFVGLYQFNVVTPAVPAGDAVPLTFSLNGTDAPQRLAIAVGN